MDELGNQAPNTPGLSETELRDMSVDVLRERARDDGVEGRSSMRKEELVAAISDVERYSGERLEGGENRQPESADAANDVEAREVIQSEDTKYAQMITSVDDRPERDGRSLVTTDHDVIRRWAEDRGATPATVTGTEHDRHLGVLRFDFPDYGGSELEHVSASNFFRLENPERSDA